MSEHDDIRRLSAEVCAGCRHLDHDVDDGNPDGIEYWCSLIGRPVGKDLVPLISSGLHRCRRKHEHRLVNKLWEL